MRWQLADATLDSERLEVRRSGTVVALEPMAVRLLSVLVDRRDRVVSRAELVDHLWQGRVVSESSLARLICAVRGALGENAAQSGSIQTLRGRGYQFVGAVRPLAKFPLDPGDVETRLRFPDARRSICELAWGGDREEPLLLLGREREQQSIESMLGSLHAKRSAVRLLTGAPGIGRSALADWGFHAARSEGIATALFTCRADPEMPPFWPWIRLLSALVHQIGDAAAALEIRDAAAMLHGRPIESHTLSAGTSATTSAPSRFEALECVGEALSHALLVKPVLVIFDDLDRADAASLELLSDLCGEGNPGFGVIATLREARLRRNRSSLRAAAALASARGSQSLVIPALGRKDSRSMLTHWAPRTLATTRIEEALSLALGNPSLIMRLSALVAEDGSAIDPSETLARRLPRWSVPGLLDQWDVLSEPGSRVIREAIRLDPGIRAEPLSQCCGLPLSRVREELSAHVTSGLLGPSVVRRDAFDFRQPLVLAVMKEAQTSQDAGDGDGAATSEATAESQTPTLQIVSH